MEEKPDSGVQDGAPSGGKLSAHGGEADLPEGEWALQGPRESVSTYASRVMIHLREYEDASKLIRRLREELRCTSAKAAGASKPRKAKFQAKVKRLSSEIQRLELRKATIREQSGPFKEKLINEDRFREMADTREQRQIGLQPESQVDDESDDDQQQAPPGSLQSHPQATCSELPARHATETSSRSSAGSGEDSDSSGQGGALMAEIKLLESPVCLQNFHLGDDLPEEAPGGHKKAKRTKPKLQEADKRTSAARLVRLVADPSLSSSLILEAWVSSAWDSSHLDTDQDNHSNQIFKRSSQHLPRRQEGRKEDAPSSRWGEY
ncbi:uncharacterized protein [Phyllobates terribilis]|uniref:uncharacterized protein n=1 Tax=Phyllobates terribilis TaxID=111132 RepID=UPI003CCB6837